MTESETILTRLVALHPGAKKTTLRNMLESKRVLVNGVIAKSLKHPVSEKDKVEVLGFAEVPTPVTKLAEGLKLVHFDADIAIINKPHGLLTSTDASERRPTVLRILSEYFINKSGKNQTHLIHRLDRDASGLLVFARTWDAQVSLKKQFFEHTITRRYDVIVHGVPKPAKGRLEHLLFEDDKTGIVRVVMDPKLGRQAILDYEVMATNRAKAFAHLQCTLFTGRKHQIRVQLRAINHNVCGDPVYGNADEPPQRLALHASHLTLMHPRSKKKISFDSEMPGSFGHLVPRLNFVLFTPSSPSC